MTGTIENRINTMREFEQNIRPDFPKEVMVELVNYCNSKCKFCAITKSTRKKRKADVKNVTRLLGEAYQNGSRVVGLHGGAEPFLHEKLHEVILNAKDIGYEYVYLSTNGLAARPDRLQECFKAGLDSIKFSVNAVDRETYKKVHGVDTFDKVLENIKQGYDLREGGKFKTYMSISIVCRQFDGISKKLLFEKVQGKIDEVVEVPLLNQSGQMLDVVTVGENLPCYVPFRRINLTVEGYLRACCSDYQNYLAVADLAQVSLKEAFYGEIMTGLRKRHIGKDVSGSLCERCAIASTTVPGPLVPHLSEINPSFFMVPK